MVNHDTATRSRMRGVWLRWPAERGIWVMLGIPWLTATLGVGTEAELGQSMLLAACLFCVALAREPLSWALWRRVRRFPPLPGWPMGVFWGAAASVLCVLWYLWVPSADHRVGWILLAAGGAWELVMRLWRARAWWPGTVSSGLIAAGVFWAAGPDLPLTATRWVAAASLAYAAGGSVAAMGLQVARVSHTADSLGPTVLLWAWSGLGAALLLLVGSRAHTLPASVAVAGLGLLHAMFAHRHPRTRDFRRLGWREAVWLAAVGASLLLLAGAG